MAKGSSTYIYHTDADDDFSQNRAGTTRTYNGVSTRFYYYDVSPDTAIEGVRLEVSNTKSVTVYKGEASNDPVTEIASITLTLQAKQMSTSLLMGQLSGTMTRTGLSSD